MVELAKIRPAVLIPGKCPIERTHHSAVDVSAVQRVQPTPSSRSNHGNDGKGDEGGGALVLERQGRYVRRQNSEGVAKQDLVRWARRSDAVAGQPPWQRQMAGVCEPYL
jgi:hypothetical protein